MFKRRNSKKQKKKPDNVLPSAESAEALAKKLSAVKALLGVSEKYWNSMYLPIFQRLSFISQHFKGREERLISLTQRDLPKLLRRAKKSVTKNASEEPVKLYVTTLCYCTLLVCSAFRTYELVGITADEGQNRYALYPWWGGVYSTKRFSTIEPVKRKGKLFASAIAPQVCQHFIEELSIWPWLYRASSWLEKLNRELLSGGEDGVLMGVGVVYFDDPFALEVVNISTDSREETMSVPSESSPPAAQQDSLLSGEFDGVEEDILNEDMSPEKNTSDHSNNNKDSAGITDTTSSADLMGELEALKKSG